MKKKILLLILVLFTSFMINGCGGSFFEEEVIQIESITSSQLSDGTTLLKITYTDSTKQPVEFKIPKGVQGNGISSILTNKNEEKKITSVTINYTDKSMTPVTFEIQDGLSIKGIYEETNEETLEHYLIVEFSDGSKSEPFLLPKGDKGEDGNGFSGFEKEDNEDGSQTYYFHFTKSEDVVVTIPAPEKGNGIESVMGSEQDGKYILTFKFTDEDIEDQTVEFNKPQDPKTWHNGSANPNNEPPLNAKDGDYYFDTYHKIIYFKESYGWIEIVNFKDSVETFEITFYLNDEDSDVEAIMPSDLSGNIKTKYHVNKNTYFSQNNQGSIPIPVRPGYIFKGWCTEQTVTATSGMFTDLTPILSDLELYAIWELIETQE